MNEHRLVKTAKFYHQTEIAKSFSALRMRKEYQGKGTNHSFQFHKWIGFYCQKSLQSVKCCRHCVKRSVNMKVSSMYQIRNKKEIFSKRVFSKKYIYVFAKIGDRKEPMTKPSNCWQKLPLKGNCEKQARVKDNNC